MVLSWFEEKNDGQTKVHIAQNIIGSVDLGENLMIEWSRNSQRVAKTNLKLKY